MTPYRVSQTAGSKHSLSNSAYLNLPTTCMEKNFALKSVEIPAPPSDPATQQVGSKRGLAESAIFGTVNQNGYKKRIVPNKHPRSPSNPVNKRVGGKCGLPSSVNVDRDDSHTNKRGPLRECHLEEDVEVSMAEKHTIDSTALDAMGEENDIAAKEDMPENASVASSVTLAASTEPESDRGEYDADIEVGYPSDFANSVNSNLDTGRGESLEHARDTLPTDLAPQSSGGSINVGSELEGGVSLVGGPWEVIKLTSESGEKASLLLAPSSGGEADVSDMAESTTDDESVNGATAKTEHAINAIATSTTNRSDYMNNLADQIASVQLSQSMKASGTNKDASEPPMDLNSDDARVADESPFGGEDKPTSPYSDISQLEFLKLKVGIPPKPVSMGRNLIPEDLKGNLANGTEDGEKAEEQELEEAPGMESPEGSINEEMFQAVDLDPTYDGFDGEGWENVSSNEKQEHNGAHRKWYKLWRR